MYAKLITKKYISALLTQKSDSYKKKNTHHRKTNTFYMLLSVFKAKKTDTIIIVYALLFRQQYLASVKYFNFI